MAKLDETDIVLKAKIAQRMKDLRESTGKNPSAFAKDLFKDRQSQHRWEKGRGISIYTINKFCQEINISMAFFFDNELFR